MRGWKRIAVFSLSGIFVFFLLMYWILTSQTFIQSQILPRVSKAIGAPLTAKKISFSLFSGIELQNLEIGSGESRLLHAKTVRCNYALMPVFRGELVIREFMLDGVEIQISQDAAGKSNLPQPPAKKVTNSPSQPSKAGSSKTGLPFNPDLKNIRISDLSIVVRQAGKNPQQPLLFEINDFNLNVPEFSLDKPSKLDFRGKLKLIRGNEIQLLNANLDGKLAVEINSQLQPKSVLMEIRLNELAGHFQEIDLARRSIDLNMKLTGNGNTFNMQQLSFTESSDRQLEAAIQLSGSGTLDPLTADLNISLETLNTSALNLIGALAGGFDFGKTLINYKGHAKFQAGTQIEADGNLNVSNASVTSPTLKLPIPPMDFKMSHAVSLDFKTQLIKISTLQSSLSEGKSETLALTLSRPLTISWNPADRDANVDPANITLSIKRLNLLLANAFLPPKSDLRLTGGELSADINIDVAKLGKQLQAGGRFTVENLGLDSGTNQIRDLNIKDEFDILLGDFSDLKIKRHEIELLHKNQVMAQLNVKGNLLLPPTKAESVLEINSEIIDTKSLISVFGSSGKASAQNPSGKETSSKTDKPGPIFPTEEPPAADLKGLWLTIHLNLERIRHGGIVISPLKSSIRIRDNKIEVKPLDLVLNQTPIHFRINVDLNKPGYSYEVHGEMGALNLDQIIDSAAPQEYRNCISGSVKGFNLDAKGAGVTGLSLSKHSDIHFKLDIGVLTLKNLPCQEMAATILLLPDVNQIIFDKGSVLLNSSGNGLSIDGTDLSGADFCLIGRGLIGFDETLNLKFTPGVGGRLEKKVSKLPTGVIFTERYGDFLLAPGLNYPVTGTFRQPQVPNWEKLLKNSFEDTLTEQGKKVILDASRQLMEDGKIDSKALSRGLKPPPQSTAPEKSTPPAKPASKQKKQQDDLIETGTDLLKGFLDKK